MYKPFKAILTRPLNIPLLDKFQRDVVDAFKSFILTVYDKLNIGLVPAPGTDDNSQILYDTGWGTILTVPLTRLLTAISPITGGGDLTADRSFGFDQTVPLGNNARVAVSKNSGAIVGTRRELNLIEGSNISLTIADDAGNEEVDVTIATTGTVPTTRTLTALSPITGGGDLSADRSFDFDETVAIGNNARVTVRKNTGADVGTRRRLNLVEGANITLTVADDAANEEVDVTIAAAAGGSVNSGTTTVNFGAFPGTTDTTATVIGQAGIVAGSIVEVHMRLVATADHSADEHWLEEMDVHAGNIVAGTGFTIYAKTRNRRLYGEYTVAWTWV